jgi:hypothetical protein
VLQHLTKTALAVRRSEQKDARLQLDRERLEILRDKNRDQSPSASASRSSSASAAHPSAPAPRDSNPPEAQRASVPQAAAEPPADPDPAPELPDSLRPVTNGPGRGQIGRGGGAGDSRGLNPGAPGTPNPENHKMV